MNKDIEAILIDLLNAQIPGFGSPISAATDLQNELGLDSLGIATLVTELGGTLDIDLVYFAEHIGEIRTVQDFCTTLENAVKTIC